eukprot:3342831-Heterocapsa_arctica.AAC.1
MLRVVAKNQYPSDGLTVIIRPSSPLLMSICNSVARRQAKWLKHVDVFREEIATSVARRQADCSRQRALSNLLCLTYPSRKSNGALF